MTRADAEATAKRLKLSEAERYALRRAAGISEASHQEGLQETPRANYCRCGSSCSVTPTILEGSLGWTVFCHRDKRHFGELRKIAIYPNREAAVDSWNQWTANSRKLAAELARETAPSVAEKGGAV